MTNNLKSEEFKTPECRFNFPNLFKPDPKELKDNGKEVYNVTAIFEKEADLGPLHSAILEVLEQKYGSKEKAKEMWGAGIIKSPLLDGGSKQGRNKKTGEFNAGMGEGVTFIRVKSNFKPVVVAADARSVPEESEIYSGMYGYLVLQAYFWSHEQQGDGVSFWLQMAQKTRDGEHLGGQGAADPSRFFTAIDDGGASERDSSTTASDMFG